MHNACEYATVAYISDLDERCIASKYSEESFLAVLFAPFIQILLLITFYSLLTKVLIINLVIQLYSLKSGGSGGLLIRTTTGV